MPKLVMFLICCLFLRKNDRRVVIKLLLLKKFLVNVIISLFTEMHWPEKSKGICAVFHFR